MERVEVHIGKWLKIISICAVKRKWKARTCDERNLRVPTGRPDGETTGYNTRWCALALRLSSFRLVFFSTDTCHERRRYFFPRFFFVGVVVIVSIDINKP